MSRSEQIMAAIAGAVVAGIFAVIVALIGHSSGVAVQQASCDCDP
jgi:hypothetical protein